MEDRSTTLEQAVVHAREGVIRTNPLRIAGVVAVAMVCGERLFLAIFALSIGLGLGVHGTNAAICGDAGTTTCSIYYTLVLSFPIVLAPLVVLAFPLARYAAHRVERYPLEWIAGALAASILIDATLAYVTLHLAHIPFEAVVLAKIYGVVFGLELLSARLATTLSLRDRRQYLMGRLLRRLTHAHQDSLIDEASAVLEAERSDAGPAVETTS